LIEERRPMLSKLTERVKFLKKEIESSMTEVLKRPIHIIGEINNL